MLSVSDIFTLGAMSAAVMIVIAGYSHTPTMAVISMCIGVALSGLLHSGYEVNVLDIAPCLSGVVMGISNTAGTTTGFLSPLLVGYMTENKVSQSLHYFFSCKHILRISLDISSSLSFVCHQFRHVFLGSYVTCLRLFT